MNMRVCVVTRNALHTSWCEAEINVTATPIFIMRHDKRERCASREELGRNNDDTLKKNSGQCHVPLGVHVDWVRLIGTFPFVAR